MSLFPGVFVTTTIDFDALDKATKEWELKAARGECAWICADCCCTFPEGMPDECTHGHILCTDLIKREREGFALPDDLTAQAQAAAPKPNVMTVIDDWERWATSTELDNQNADLISALADIRKSVSHAEDALCEVLHAVNDYLPPDGIDAKECLNRVISAVDPWPLTKGYVKPLAAVEPVVTYNHKATPGGVRFEQYAKDPIPAWAVNIRSGQAAVEPAMPKLGCVNHDCDKCKAGEPVATMWREKNAKLYPGIVFDLTDTGKSLPLGVRHQLYTSPPDHTAEMESLRKANLDCVDHFNAIKADYDEAQKAMRLALEALKEAKRRLTHNYPPCAEIPPAIAALEGALK